MEKEEDSQRFENKFSSQEELEAVIKSDPYSLGLLCPPKESCGRCYGRGHIGKKAGTNQFIACTCVLKQKKGLK